MLNQMGLLLVILSFPPQCTYRLQPLDVSFFAPFDAYYNQEITEQLKSNSGRTVGLYQISKILYTAYLKAASVGNSISGFKVCGIRPFNPDIFQEHLYGPSSTTDRDIENINTEVIETNINPDVLTIDTVIDENIKNISLEMVDNIIQIVSPILHCSVQPVS